MFAELRRLLKEREASVLIEAPLSFRAGPLVSQRLQILLGFLEPTRGSLSYIVRKVPKTLFRVTSLWFLIPLIVLMALNRHQRPAVYCRNLAPTSLLGGFVNLSF